MQIIIIIQNIKHNPETLFNNNSIFSPICLQQIHQMLKLKTTKQKMKLNHHVCRDKTIAARLQFAYQGVQTLLKT